MIDIMSTDDFLSIVQSFEYDNHLAISCKKKESNISSQINTFNTLLKKQK